jgi:hypothetical protein
MSSAAPALFLPPVLGQHLASPAIEEIDLARDEMANIAWAIERIVPSLSGSRSTGTKPIRRAAA